MYCVLLIFSNVSSFKVKASNDKLTFKARYCSKMCRYFDVPHLQQRYSTRVQNSVQSWTKTSLLYSKLFSFSPIMFSTFLASPPLLFPLVIWFELFLFSLSLSLWGVQPSVLLGNFTNLAFRNVSYCLGYIVQLYPFGHHEYIYHLRLRLKYFGQNITNYLFLVVEKLTHKNA